MSKIIKCCVCKSKVKTNFGLKFLDLLGSDSHEYTQLVSVCPKCGYIFTQNPFSEKQLENRYKKMSKFEYDANLNLNVIKDSFKIQCIRQKHFIEENINEYDSILEIGAASGFNLSLYKKDNKTVQGVEPSELNCKLSKKYYNIQMFNGMFDDYYNLYSHQKYDIIFLSMVLEHIVNPFDFILKCKDLCKRYIFIEVPTLDYKYLEEPYGMFAEEHVSIFTLENLTNLMHQAGFKLVNKEFIFGDKYYLPAGYPGIVSLWEINTEKDYFSLKPEISSLERFNKYVDNNAILLEEIKNKINEIPSDIKLGLWGAGHHISMLLANTDLISKNITKIYDSDERKRGLKILNIPIEPFDTSDFINKKIEGVLITSYTAQTKIIKVLKDKNVDIPIYTLYDL